MSPDVPTSDPPPTAAPADPRRHLRADCSRCVALCCVVPAFAASADFAIDKPAGRPCPNLDADHGCTVHADLRVRGFPGCAVFDCFGAGQHVVGLTSGSGSGTGSRSEAIYVATVFPVVRQLKELLWYLVEADTLVTDGGLRARCRQLRAETETLLDGPAGPLTALDAAAHRRAAGALLELVSRHVRADVPGLRAEHRDADLVGADLRGADLRGACLRGAYLLGADLRGADLHLADLLGADLRGADLRGAGLTRALFLTQPQLDAGRGDGATTVPPFLARPAHWPTVE